MFELNRFYNGVLKLGRNRVHGGLPTRQESRHDLETCRAQLAPAERNGRRFV